MVRQTSNNCHSIVKQSSNDGQIIVELMSGEFVSVSQLLFVTPSALSLSLYFATSPLRFVTPSLRPFVTLCGRDGADSPQEGALFEAWRTKATGEALCSAIAEKCFPTRTISGQPVMASGIARPINHLTFVSIIVKGRREISKKILL